MRWFQKKIDQAEANANEEWKRAAYDRVRWLAERRRIFTSEDVILWLESKSYKTKEKRALGAIMQYYQRNGYIKALGWTTAKRRERHNAPVRVWESLINDNPWREHE